MRCLAINLKVVRNKYLEDGIIRTPFRKFTILPRRLLPISFSKLGRNAYVCSVILMCNKYTKV